MNNKFAASTKSLHVYYYINKIVSFHSYRLTDR